MVGSDNNNNNSLLLVLVAAGIGIGGYYLYQKMLEDDEDNIVFPPTATNIYVEDRNPDYIIEDTWPDYVAPLYYYQYWPTWTYAYPYFVPNYRMPSPRHRPGRQPTPEAPSNTIPLPAPDPTTEWTPRSPTLIEPPQNADTALQNYIRLTEYF